MTDLMTYRLQTLLTGLLALLTAALLALGAASANPTSGGYQLFEPTALERQNAIQLASLGNFDTHAKVASECCNAPNNGPRFITRADGQTLDTNSITIPGPTNSPYGKMDYLLGKVPGNQDSIGKGGYFGGTLGFKSGDDLAGAMQTHLKYNFGSAVMKGSKVEVTAPITGPNGVTANVKAAWQVKSDGSVSFVTAFPGPKQ